MAKAKAKASTKEDLEHAECVRLNELAIRYPWKVFTQGELMTMTGYGREVVSAACNSPEVDYQFQMARPEDVHAWVKRQGKKATVKELKS